MRSFPPSISFAIAGAAVIVVLICQLCFRKRPSLESVPRVRADFPALAIALEGYREAWGEYPAMIPMAAFGDIPSDRIRRWRPTTIFPGSATAAGLTTPIAYLPRLFEDVYPKDLRGRFLPYAYFKDDRGGWILISSGPDGDYDIDPPRDDDVATTVPSVSLIQHTYDPSNGLKSDGDIYRVKD